MAAVAPRFASAPRYDDRYDAPPQHQAPAHSPHQAPAYAPPQHLAAPAQPAVVATQPASPPGFMATVMDNAVVIGIGVALIVTILVLIWWFTRSPAEDTPSKPVPPQRPQAPPHPPQRPQAPPQPQHHPADEPAAPEPAPVAEPAAPSPPKPPAIPEPSVAQAQSVDDAELMQYMH